MNKKNIIFVLAMSVCICGTLKAQEFGLEYTTELQSDFRRNNNFLNQLKLKGEMQICEHFKARMSSLSISQTEEVPLINNYQIYSNLEAENLPFTIAVAELEWELSENKRLNFGIRHMNDDYFTSDVTSLFTNSSCGIFPTISCNYPSANYPVSSVGVHYAYDVEKWCFQASLYNGMGYNCFTGRNNIFRLCPGSDGVFALTQGEFRYHDSGYFLGACMHYGKPEPEMKRLVRGALWGYGEQKLSESLSVMVAYSHAFGTDNECKDFAGVGGKLALGNIELGVFSDYVRILESEEWATEFTCKAQVNKYLYIQPAIHFISNVDVDTFVGLVRFGVEL